MTTDLEALASHLLDMQEPSVVLIDAHGNGIAVALDGRHPLDVLAAISPEVAESLDAVGMLVHGSAVTADPDGGNVADAGRVVATLAISRTGSAGIVLMPTGVQTDNTCQGVIPDAVRAFLG